MGEQHAAPCGASVDRQRDTQVCLSHTRPTHKQDVDGLIQEGQAGQLAHARRREARLETKVELLQRAQHREARSSDTRIDRAIGFVGELQLDQPSQVGGEAGLTLDGPIGFGFEGGGHAVQAELRQLPFEHTAFGLG